MATDNAEAARRIHDGTKHPSGALLNPQHHYGPGDRPVTYKRYHDLAPIALPEANAGRRVPALEAIGVADVPRSPSARPDRQTLANVLHRSAGVTWTKSFPGGEIAFRAASCTGALYHIELYLVCGALSDLEAGVYHYDARAHVLRRLRDGDHRARLAEATADHPHVAHAPCTLVYSDVFWRNAVKYQARTYRHAFWDSGVILSHTLALGVAHALPATLVTGFVDEAVNTLLGLDGAGEAVLALVPLGYRPDDPVPAAPELTPLAPGRVEGGGEAVLPAIRDAVAASALETSEAVAAWRGGAEGLVPADAGGERVALTPASANAATDDTLTEVIVRRGSTRQFDHRPIGREVLATVLDRATAGVPADYLAAHGDVLFQPRLIVSAVEGLAPGVYAYHRADRALEQLRAGDFRSEAGQLGLGQALAADAAVSIYFLTDLEAVLEQLGNRGYRAAQLDAAIAAGRIYLAAYAQEIGATGLTFYDDPAVRFLRPDGEGEGWAVMFLMLLGHKAT